MSILRSCQKKMVLPFILALCLMIISAVTARPLDNKASKENAARLLADPNRQLAVHSTGNVAMSITNMGVFGAAYFGSPDCSGEPCPSCEFPKDSDVEYLFEGGYWIGAVVGNDTLVTVGMSGWHNVMEIVPDSGDNGEIIARSNDIGDPLYSPDAVALLDLIAVSTDTITDPGEVPQDPIDGRPHIPLPFELRQQSYSWADPPLDDFVMFECFLTNIGSAPMSDVWIGIYMDADVFHISNQATGYLDDITGYLPGAKTAYIMDNDGDPDLGSWVMESAKGVFGVKYHGSDPPRDNVNYNWWISNVNATLDFGPRLTATPGDPFRPFGSGGLGTPTGDKNKYYMLSHNEVDYDQLFTAVSHTDEGFIPPPAPLYAEDLANGYDTRFLLSFGPYDIAAGDSIRFIFSTSAI